MFYIYVLHSKKDNNLYIGYTGNLKQRFKCHQDGGVLSTKHRRPLELVYYEAYINDLDAKKREVFLKSGSGHRFLNKQLLNWKESISK
jgi:putative endonuclease